MKAFNLAKFVLATAAVLPVHVHAQGLGIDEPTTSSSSSASLRELLLGDGAIPEGINDILEVQESPYRLALIDNYYYHRPEGGGEDGRVDQGGGDSSSRPRPPFRRRFRRGGKFMMMGKRRGHFNGPSLRGRSLLSETETTVDPHWMPLDERRASYSSASSPGPSLTVSMDLSRRPSKMTVPHRFRSSIQSAIATWNNVSCPRGGEEDGASTVSILDFQPLSKSTNLGSDVEEEIMTPGLFTERLLSENSWNASDISISGDIMIAGFYSLQEEGKNDLLLASVSTYVHSDDPNVIAFVEVYLNDGVSWAAFEYPKLVHAAQQQNTVDLETVLLHNLGLALGLPATAPEDRKKQFRPSHRGEPVMNDEYLGARRHLHPYDRQAFCSAFQGWASDGEESDDVVSDGDGVVAVSGASE